MCDSSDSDFEAEIEATAGRNKKGGASKRRAKPMKKTRPNKVIKFSEDCYEFVYCDVCKVSFVLTSVIGGLKTICALIGEV